MTIALPALDRIAILIRNFTRSRNVVLERPQQSTGAELPVSSALAGKQQSAISSARASKLGLGTTPLPKPEFCRPSHRDQRSSVLVEYTRSNLG
jgi:hypothetical protein